jgi:hypothetical protein
MEFFLSSEGTYLRINIYIKKLFAEKYICGHWLCVLMDTPPCNAGAPAREEVARTFQRRPPYFGRLELFTTSSLLVPHQLSDSGSEKGVVETR